MCLIINREKRVLTIYKNGYPRNNETTKCFFLKIILTVVLEKIISDFGIIPSEKKCSFNGF